MKFERNIDPKEAMEIGRRANAIRIDYIISEFYNQTYHEYETRSLNQDTAISFLTVLCKKERLDYDVIRNKHFSLQRHEGCEDDIIEIHKLAGKDIIYWDQLFRIPKISKV